MDLDLLELGDDVVLGEGATVIAHKFEGAQLNFQKVYSAPTSCSFV